MKIKKSTAWPLIVVSIAMNLYVAYEFSVFTAEGLVSGKLEWWLVPSIAVFMCMVVAVMAIAQHYVIDKLVTNG